MNSHATSYMTWHIGLSLSLLISIRESSHSKQNSGALTDVAQATFPASTLCLLSLAPPNHDICHVLTGLFACKSHAPQRRYTCTCCSLGLQYLFLKSSRLNARVFYLFFKAFFMWTIFKVFMECVTILPLFYVLGFWLWDVWDLSSLTRNSSHTPALEGKVLITGPPGKSCETLLGRLIQGELITTCFSLLFASLTVPRVVDPSY